ncbi:DUF559 domain-containing protein (plasmid) [Acaryochloris sp. CCMEE 5410]|nr:DUF559 domain-containing protein [Acaryochloris sp. CCMEE 5410]
MSSKVFLGQVFGNNCYRPVFSEVAFLSSVTFEHQAMVVARLALHQSQRCQSVPTLSVLVGKTIAARQMWTQWIKEAHRQTTVCVYESRIALFEAWLGAISPHNLRSQILQKVATLVNQPVDQLAALFTNTSDYQRQLFWQRTAPFSEDVLILRSLLESLPPVPTSGQLAKNVSANWLKKKDSPTFLKSFATIEQVLSPSEVPGLLVLLPDNNEQTTIHAVITALTQLVEVVPLIPVGLVLTEDQGELWLDTLPESKVKAILRSGLIEVPSPASDDLRQWLGDHGVEDEDRQQSILRLAEKHGTTSDSLETALVLMNPANQSDSTKADTVFRSYEEWLLFQYLEARPATTGRFQTNARLQDINFSNGPMEVDFLDAEAKIVIELDGYYYHCQSRDNYRRDRRKDRILQLQHYLVLRFLSEDVVKDFEIIFDAIDQAFTSRQSLINHSEA